MASAVSCLYIEHIGEIRRFLTRRLSCVEAAAELAHEVFIRYMVAAPESPIQNPRAFLFRIAGNIAIDHVRANPLKKGQWIDIAECGELASDYPSPERFAAARQELDRLRQAIEELPPRAVLYGAHHLPNIKMPFIFKGKNSRQVLYTLALSKKRILWQVLVGEKALKKVAFQRP